MTIKFHNVLFIFIFRLTKLREKYMSDVGVLAPHTKCIVCRGGLRDPVVSLQCFHTCKFSVSGVSHRNNKWFRDQKSIKSRKRLDQSALKYRKFYVCGGGLINSLWRFNPGKTIPSKGNNNKAKSRHILKWKKFELFHIQEDNTWVSNSLEFNQNMLS